MNKVLYNKFIVLLTSRLLQTNNVCNNKRKYFCPVNRYNGSVTVVTVHLNTQKYSKKKSSQRIQNVSLCNDLVIIVMVYQIVNN
jgi:hypothetical protein